MVLVLHHDDDGAQGLVLNRPIDADVDAVLPGWEEHATRPAKVFQGGPVQLDSALGLVAVPGDSPEPTGVRRLFGAVGAGRPRHPADPGGARGRRAADLRRVRRVVAGPARGRDRGTGSWFVVRRRGPRRVHRRARRAVAPGAAPPARAAALGRLVPERPRAELTGRCPGGAPEPRRWSLHSAGMSDRLPLDERPSDRSSPSASEPGCPTPTAVLERTETVPEGPEPGDHERFSHYVRKEKILESALSGEPVIALCGKVWVPGRDPEKFPVCPTCKEIYEGLRAPQDGKD